MWKCKVCYRQEHSAIWMLSAGNRMEGNNGSLELQIFPKNVFNGFLHWAHIACWEKYIKRETQFLLDFFVENGHERKFLETLIKDQNNKKK